MSGRLGRPLLAGMAAAAIVWVWMFLTVRYNYGGDWTALFFIGPATPQTPPIAAEHPYLWRGTNGYDGQTFHVMAHDPWLKYGTPENFEIAPQRYVRILVPMLAWLLALGQDRWIDPAYYAVILGFTFLGAYWTSRWAVRKGFSAAAGLVFLATPATITSADRMMCDVALAALCAAFVLYVDTGSRWKIFIVLACAALVRETGAIPAVAFGLYSFTLRRWRDAAMAAAALVPLAAWEIYVRAHSLGSTRPPPVLGWIPFEGFVRRILHVVEYPLAPFWRAVAVVSDYVALAAIAAALAMAARLAIRRDWNARAAALYGFALAAVFLRGGGEWFDAYSFGRLLTPLLLTGGMIYLPRVGLAAFAPTVIVGGHVIAWLLKQAAGVWYGLIR